MSGSTYKRIILVTGVVILAVFTGLYVYQEKRVARYMKALDDIENEIDAKNTEINSVMNDLSGKQDQLLNQYNDMNILMSNELSSRKAGNDFFNFMDNAESRSAYREQQRLVIDSIYGDLYRELGLNEDETEELRQLLVDKQMINLEILFSLIKGDMTDAEKRDNERKYLAMLQNAENNIRDFFQVDEYDIYLDYVDDLEYRNFVIDYKGYLAKSDIDLDEDQERMLFEEVREVTNNFNFSEDLNLMDLRTQGKLSTANRNRLLRHLDEQAELDSLILNKSKDFLDDIQNQKLGEFQTMRLNMTQLGFDISSDMETGKSR